MISFGTCFVILEGFEGFEDIVCKDPHVDKNVAVRFLYTTFLLTFEGTGAKGLMDAAFSDGHICFFALALFFRVVVLMMAMNLIIGVMGGEWSKCEPVARA